MPLSLYCWLSGQSQEAASGHILQRNRPLFRGQDHHHCSHRGWLLRRYPLRGEKKAPEVAKWRKHGGSKIESRYWWLVAKDEQSKTVLIFGSDRSEEDARRKGLELLSGTDFEVKMLPTRDLGKASSLLKGNKLETTHSLTRATERLVHERGMRQTWRRRERRLHQGGSSPL